MNPQTDARSSAHQEGARHLRHLSGIITLFPFTLPNDHTEDTEQGEIKHPASSQPAKYALNLFKE
jgi:hypothetical protein